MIEQDAETSIRIAPLQPEGKSPKYDHREGSTQQPRQYEPSSGGAASRGKARNANQTSPANAPLSADAFAIDDIEESVEADLMSDASLDATDTAIEDIDAMMEAAEQELMEQGPLVDPRQIDHTRSRPLVARQTSSRTPPPAKTHTPPHTTSAPAIFLPPDTQSVYAILLDLPSFRKTLIEIFTPFNASTTNSVEPRVNDANHPELTIVRYRNHDHETVCSTPIRILVSDSPTASITNEGRTQIRVPVLLQPQYTDTNALVENHALDVTTISKHPDVQFIRAGILVTITIDLATLLESRV